MDEDAGEVLYAIIFSNLMNKIMTFHRKCENVGNPTTRA